MKRISHTVFLLCMSAVAGHAVADTITDNLTADELFRQLSGQFPSDDDSGPPASSPDFGAMMEEGNRQLREGMEKHPGHAFGSDTLISLHQGNRYMTLRLSESLGNECPTPTMVRLSNQTVSGPLQMEQFLDGEWELLALYDSDTCRVLDVELVRPGMADFGIDHQ